MPDFEIFNIAKDRKRNEILECMKRQKKFL